MAEERKLSGPSYEDVVASQEEFEQNFLRGLWDIEGGPVCAIGPTVIKNKKGRERAVFYVLLGVPPTTETLKELHLPKSFKRIRVVYAHGGPFTASKRTS